MISTCIYLPTKISKCFYSRGIILLSGGTELFLGQPDKLKFIKYGIIHLRFHSCLYIVYMTLFFSIFILTFCDENRVRLYVRCHHNQELDISSLLGINLDFIKQNKNDLA